jgi:hypothetical protein
VAASDPASTGRQNLLKTLSTQVADLNLSTRAATALRSLNIKYVYELVQTSPLVLFGLPNFGEKSFRKVEEKLAALDLTLGMRPDGLADAGAVLATLVTSVRAGVVIPERERRQSAHRGCQRLLAGYITHTVKGENHA